MSLAFTVETDAANLYEFRAAKVWYKFEDHTSEFDAWATANPSEPQATQFSGRAAQIRVSNKFLTNWPSPADGAGNKEYCPKWSGGCLRDYSSGMGGFCLLEDSDIDLSDTPGSPVAA